MARRATRPRVARFNATRQGGGVLYNIYRTIHGLRWPGVARVSATTFRHPKARQQALETAAGLKPRRAITGVRKRHRLFKGISGMF